MKLVIEQDGVKRELSAPFQVCVSRDDVEDLIDQLRKVAADPEFHYGWFTVWHHLPSEPNTKPKPWTE